MGMTVRAKLVAAIVLLCGWTALASGNAFGRQQGRAAPLVDEADAPSAQNSVKRARWCLQKTNGEHGMLLERKRWSKCSWGLVQQMRPAWSLLHAKRSTRGSSGGCRDKSRHVTVVRYGSNAASLQWLKALTGFTFTIIDKRNGEDDFTAQFGPASTGEVLLQRNQGDEAAAYLARIVESYDKLSDLELFVHETELLTDEGKALLRVADRVSAEVAFLPLKKPLFTMGEMAPVGRHPRKWGNPELDDLLKRFYAWVWLDERTPYQGRWSTQCCGQFLTSRHQIRQRPRAFWQYLRTVATDRLLTTYLDIKRYNNGRAYFFYGHLFERLWGAMLGQPPTGTTYDKLVEIELDKAAASRAACAMERSIRTTR